jgi:hypothetical protein
MYVRYYLYHVHRTQRREKEEKKKEGGGIFVRHSTTAMATKERYLFFSNKSTSSMSFPSRRSPRFFFSCVCVCARCLLYSYHHPYYDYSLDKQKVFFAVYV